MDVPSGNEDPTTKQPKENSLNLEEDLEKGILT